MLHAPNPLAQEHFEGYLAANGIALDDFPYSSGHVHIPGPKAVPNLELALSPSLSPSSSSSSGSCVLSSTEIDSFVKHGYFVVRDAVRKELIDETKRYIDDNYTKFTQISKRSDDWRCHFQVDFNKIAATNAAIEHGALLNLLTCSENVMSRVHQILKSPPAGIFYTQMALRTPMKNSQLKSPEYTESLNSSGSDYHIDGQANESGDRFPDHWTLQVGICLTDQVVSNGGNFTVFSGCHTSVDWSSYCDKKKRGTLPDLGTPSQIQLMAGDAIFAHVLLPHRGGRNVHRHGTPPQDYRRAVPWGTREMVYFRIKASGIDYASPERSRSVLTDPWIEYAPQISKFASSYPLSSSSPQLMSTSSLTAVTSPVVEKRLQCFFCNSTDQVVFENFPCGCCKTCRKCAMRLCTGGRCKKCKSMYSGFKSIGSSCKRKTQSDCSDSDSDV